MASSKKIPATLIPGDGIGPEIMDAVLAVLDAVKAPFEWDRQAGGLAGIEASGDPLPIATLDSIRRTRLALKGPLTTPVGGGFRSVNVRMREEFGLYANVRPVRTMIPGATLRRYRYRSDSRKYRRSLCCFRTFHRGRGRPARRCDLTGSQHPR